MQLTLREISEALTSVRELALGESFEMDTVASGYSIDSRTLQPGDLFFAVRGERLDGHAFLSTAFEKGACGAVVAADWAQAPALRVHEDRKIPKRNWLVVGNTTAALQKLAMHARREWGRQVVAITGSAGKTTTKEICATLLGSTRTVYKSEGNLNNLYGVPLTLLRVDAAADVAVIELAMSAREEIRTLAQIAAPEIGVITNVNPVHLQFFSSIDEIALAKRELVEELDAKAVAVLNADDPRVSSFASYTKARVVTYGQSRGADVRLENIRISDLERSEFDVVLSSGARASCRLRVLGRHNISNAGAAIAVAVQLGIPLVEVARRLELVRPARMRGEILKFDEGFTVIDDTYNSNPRALTEVLSTVTLAGGFKRKIVAAGEMLELGTESRALHAACGKAMAEAGIDVLIAVQGEAEAMASAARVAGMSADRVFFYPTPAEAAEKLCRILAPGDLVLMKGSRGVKMDLALDCLRQKFSVKAH
jgi:UDP-N-acetylmuramoyl-tripeptide--D-alanyl-D-alanine ligase